MMEKSGFMVIFLGENVCLQQLWMIWDFFYLVPQVTSGCFSPFTHNSSTKEQEKRQAGVKFKYADLTTVSF